MLNQNKSIIYIYILLHCIEVMKFRQGYSKNVRAIGDFRSDQFFSFPHFKKQCLANAASLHPLLTILVTAPS